MESSTVGALIRQRRKEKGFTQKRLSEMTGIAEISIRNYEANKYYPKIQQLNKLSVALGVQVSEFLELY